MVDKKTTDENGAAVLEVDQNEMEVDDGGEQNDPNVETADNNSEEVTNELTQTDHLNKKLLEAFLSRINTTDQGNTVSVESEVDSTEWADKTT